MSRVLFCVCTSVDHFFVVNPSPAFLLSLSYIAFTQHNNKAANLMTSASFCCHMDLSFQIDLNFIVFRICDNVNARSCRLTFS